MKNKRKSNERLIARVNAMVDEVARVTTLEIAEALDISPGSVSDILKDKLRYSNVSAKWIPQNLT